MSHFLIFNAFTDESTKILEKHPEVKILKMSDVIVKKIHLANGPWIRDHIVKINENYYETCNPKGIKKIIVAEYLRRQGLKISHLNFMPIQGGHLVKMNGENYCASSCGVNFSQTLLDFSTHTHHSWEYESLEEFKKGESSAVINKLDPKIKVIPSLREFPWSFHLDLLVAPLSTKEILLSNPLLGINVFTPEQKDSLQNTLSYYQHLFEAYGFKIYHFPTYLELGGQKPIFHSPLNGLMIDKCFYFTLIEGMDEFNNFTLQYTQSLTLPVEFKPIFLPLSALGKGGGLRCLSLEFD